MDLCVPDPKLVLARLAIGNQRLLELLYDREKFDSACCDFSTLGTVLPGPTLTRQKDQGSLLWIDSSIRIGQLFDCCF